MRNSFSFILAASLLMSCSDTTVNHVNAQSQDTVQTEKFIKTISADEFKTLTESGNGIILDVRTPEEISAGYIPNSSAINFYDPQFEEKINLMDKNKEIYVYCKAGSRSIKAAEMLSENGFNKVYNLDGGIMAWERKGYQVETSGATTDSNIHSLSVDEFDAILKTDQPVLVDFHTQWCMPCRKMAPVIDSLETEFNGKAGVIRVDVDASKELGEKYNVAGVPVFVIFKDGVEVWRHSGIISSEELRKKLNTYM
ncbi:MAG: thioredoxin fold domain-containing protein [Crocinitomicaceae bacterium]|nr:thioredoxin fold domain-containing protein [Crocinitomicaceae bacterium]MBK8925878.1 thioredoxin fold domain-containing protein [Crocinitomicaceae bacterium]